MAHVENLQVILQQLQKRKMAGKTVSVIVGYTANYSVPVHENMQVFHSNGQAKFLEQPAREMQKDLGAIAVNALKQGKSLTVSLLLAGLTLQRASQQLVPVDTGNLKGSAFTRKDDGV